MNILEAIRDAKVFRQFFKANTWLPATTFLAALFALPMTPEMLAIYQQHTGRTTPPTSPLHEAWLVIGRRGGKSFILAVIAVFLACFKDWRQYLGPGEVGTIMIITPDRRQARVIMRFVSGLLHGVPMLAAQIKEETRESITLKNNIVIEIHTASFRTPRGYLIIAALLDEIAYLPTDENSAEPDVEIINAIKPGMATVPEAMLLCASSPHARRGAMWDAYRKHFGKDGDPVLVWQADTRSMNASVPQSYIDAHMADDPARASAEYLAQFRSDLEAFVVREAVEACISRGVRERLPQHDITYHAAVDPSGGSADSMTLCVAHMDYGRGCVVVDALRETKPPFSPEIVTSEFCALLKTYHITTISGDRYAGEWPREMFGKFGVYYEPSAKVKSALYIDLLPLINSKRIDLLDHRKMFNQLIGLERRVARGGHESIDHAPNQHDDLANVIAGVASIVFAYGGYSLEGFQPNHVDADASGGADNSATGRLPRPQCNENLADWLHGWATFHGRWR